MNLPTVPGAPHIAYRNQQLCVEQVPLSELARRHGTPLFVYSEAAILDALAAYQRPLAGRDARICYAMKANSTLAVLQVLARAGCGFDIVSGGELERVIAAGAPASSVIFSGVGKTRAEMRRALELGIACFNVESEAELEVLDAVAQSMGKRAPVSIRVNPNVDPKTHPYISTGLKGNKFGIAHEAYRGHLPPRRGTARCCRWSASIAISARRSPRKPRSSTRWTACSTWCRRSRPKASRSGTWTSVADWASTTTATTLPQPTCCGASCWPGWMRGVLASAR